MNDLRSLFPQYTEEQGKEAEENLQRYLDVVLRIYRRIEQDPILYRQLQDALTDRKARATRYKRQGAGVPSHV